MNSYPDTSILYKTQDDGLDDGPEVIWTDDQDDFDDNFATPAGLWGRYTDNQIAADATRRPGSATSTKRATDLVVRAHTMLQGFVNTFAPAGEQYEVTFDATVTTASTDLKNRKVAITSLPLFDPTLTFEDAGAILMAMAAHEVGHTRDSQMTVAAVRKYFTDPIAHRLSNLLDDVRGERNFGRIYPGYAGLFEPAIEYVAKRDLDKLGVELAPQSLDKPFSLAVAAVRYSKWADWSDPTIAAERDWYADWAVRSTATNSTKLHIAGIAEAIAHIAAAPKQPPPPSTDSESGPTTPPSEPSGSESGQSDGEYAKDQADAFPACLADAISDAATDNGAYSPLGDNGAQIEVKESTGLVEVPGFKGVYGQIKWSVRGITRNATPASQAATAAIRAAFARSRSGHGAVDNRLPAGTLDNKNIYRLAMNDRNICRRNRAPSVANYRVWLMVDVSGSMGGQPIRDATAVAKALAAATRYLPNINLNIWGWTTPKAGAGAFIASRVWRTGQAVERVERLTTLAMQGTPDLYVVAWAAKALQDACGSTEQGVLIIASDGAGGLDASVIAAARKRGVAVVSVAIGQLQSQEAIYGKGSYIEWAGSILNTAKPLGQLIGRLAAGKSQR